ncbi:hypothetical protein ACLB2K_068379 [Fragaria x ananassa]
MTIVARKAYGARHRDFNGPSQGPSKKAASSSASLAGSGYSSGSSSSAWNRIKGRHRRPFRSQLGRQQTR